jgi:hypothetical protein
MAVDNFTAQAQPPEGRSLASRIGTRVRQGVGPGMSLARRVRAMRDLESYHIAPGALPDPQGGMAWRCIWVSPITHGG